MGDLVRATGRHNFRPAHLHFLIFKQGFKTLISQIYSNDDDKLETDVQFGVTRALIGDYVRHRRGRRRRRTLRANGIRSTRPSSWSRAKPAAQAADPVSAAVDIAIAAGG